MQNEPKENQVLRNNVAVKFNVVFEQDEVKQMYCAAVLLQPACCWSKIVNKIKSDATLSKEFKKVDGNINSGKHDDNIRIFERVIHELYTRKNNGFGVNVTEDYFNSFAEIWDHMLVGRCIIDGDALDLMGKYQILQEAREQMEALELRTDFTTEKILTSWATYQAVYDAFYHSYWSRCRIMPKRELYIEALRIIRDDASGTVLAANNRDKDRAMMDMAEKIEEHMVYHGQIVRPEGFIKTVIGVKELLKEHKKISDNGAYEAPTAGIGSTLCEKGIYVMEDTTNKAKSKVIGVAGSGEATNFFYNFSSSFDGVSINQLSMVMSMMGGKNAIQVASEYAAFRTSTKDYLKGVGVKERDIEFDKYEIFKGSDEALSRIYKTNQYIGLSMVATLARSFITCGENK